MTTLEEQLESVENTLKKCAEELGTINIDNCRLQQLNQEFSDDIHKLQKKIAKKHHTIEQEQSDKQIIHQKLIKAEKVKEELQIQVEKIKARKEQQHLKEQIEEERKKQVLQHHRASKHQDHPTKSQNHPTKEQEKPSHEPIKSEPTPQKTTPPASKGTPSKPVKEEKPLPKVQGVKEQIYTNTQKGEYQPPALFFQQNDSESDSEQDNSKVLEKLKQKLKQDKEELDQDDD